MNRLWKMRRADPPPGPPKWVPVLGQLQKTLEKGDYLPLRPLPMFESNFVQVTSQGAPVYVNHRTNHLTMGMAATQPGPVLPDLLLIAQPSESKDCPNLVLTRMIPLDLVRLYVHSLSAWCLKLRLSTGRYYYLELDAPDREMAFLFARWAQLIHLLQEPTNFWAPRTLNTPLVDLAQEAPAASTWQLQDQPCTRRPVRTEVPTSPRKPTPQQQRKATASRPRQARGAVRPDLSAPSAPSQTPKSRFKSQAVGDSVPLVWSQLEHSGPRKKATGKKARPSSSQAKIVSAKHRVTIRTLFSIFSRTFTPELSSSKGCSPDGTVVLGGVVESPSHCISNSPDFSLLLSHEQLDVQVGTGDLADRESSTLSFSSFSHFSQATSSPNLFWPGPYSSIPRPPGSQKTPAVPVDSWKAPSTPDQSRKAPDGRAPSRKPPADPAASQKGPSIPAAARKAPLTRDQSWKVSAGPAAPQKTPVLAPAPQKAPATPAPPMKTPRVPASPGKPESPPGPTGKSMAPPTPSQKALSPLTQYQRPWEPADLGALSAGSPVGNVLERSQTGRATEPLMLVGTQETKVVEVWTQKMSLELPSHAAKKEMKEVVVTRAQEVAVDGLKGKGTREDKARSTEEEMSVDVPGSKSTVMGQQEKWVKTQQLAVEGASQEQRRPLCGEELGVAKRMVTAKAEAPPLRPRLYELPSWLLISQVSAVSAEGPEPLQSRPVPTLEGTPVAAKEWPQVGYWSKRGMGVRVGETSSPRAEAAAEELPSDQRGPPKVRPRSKRVPKSPKLERVSEMPIPLPATRWEDVPSPSLSSPISQMKARVPQVNRESQETGEMPGQGPLAKVGSSLETLVPKLLEIERVRNMANTVDKRKKKLNIYTPWPRPGEQDASEGSQTQTPAPRVGLHC